MEGKKSQKYLPSAGFPVSRRRNRIIFRSLSFLADQANNSIIEFRINHRKLYSVPVPVNRRSVNKFSLDHEDIYNNK